MAPEEPEKVRCTKVDLANELKCAFPGMIPSKRVAKDVIETLALIIQGALLAGLSVDLPGVARLKAIPGLATKRRHFAGSEWEGITKGRIKATISKEMIAVMQNWEPRLVKRRRKSEAGIHE